MTYVYPAVLRTEDGEYSVYFPDIQGAITCGGDLATALQNAQEVLSMMAVQMEEKGEAFPSPTDMRDIQHDGNSIVTLIMADTMTYRKQLRDVE